MAIGKLYISHKNFDFSKLDSKLINKKNLKHAITNTNTENYHTSVEDCNIKIGQIESELLVHCQSIECVDISWKTINFLENHTAYAHIAYLLTTKFKDISTGLDDLVNDILEITTYQRATRASSGPKLWIPGCSWSTALGVDKDQRWSSLVSKALSLEEINLAKNGASIWDSADQLFRADIQKNDLVIWGLTSAGRVDTIFDNQLKSFSFKMAENFDYYKLDYFFSNTQYLMAMRQIQQVIHYCDKIKARLYILNFLDPAWFPLMLKDHKNFLDLQHEFDDETFLYKMIDYGTDHEHPGPLQHKEYAKKIIKFIQGNNG